jgi:hypothetical protein
MSETRPASGASNQVSRFAKSDDGTSFQGRRASREQMELARSVKIGTWRVPPDRRQRAT